MDTIQGHPIPSVPAGTTHRQAPPAGPLANLRAWWEDAADTATGLARGPARSTRQREGAADDRARVAVSVGQPRQGGHQRLGDGLDLVRRPHDDHGRHLAGAGGPDRHLRERVLCGHPQLPVPVRRHHLGLDPPAARAAGGLRRLGAAVGPDLGAGGRDHPGRAERDRQLPVASLLPVLGAAHHRGGHLRDLGHRRPRPGGAI